MLRVPSKRVDSKSLRAYFVGHAARAKLGGDHLILDLHSEDENPDYYEESQGSLDALAPLRTELMRGDLRPAYLAWLLAVQMGAWPARAVDDPDLPLGAKLRRAFRSEAKAPRRPGRRVADDDSFHDRTYEALPVLVRKRLPQILKTTE